MYTGVVAAGLISGLLGIEQEIPAAFLEEKFSSKSEEIVKNNLAALEKGFELSRELISSGDIVVNIPKRDKVPGEIIINGSDAVSLGALAGGCDFISSYPMSPATGVLSFLAKNARSLGVAVEQAEDEIAAINMAVGASYGGARAMVSTSGGGLSLMSEGVSLAGITELPVVLHIGQRPGPATGMATRTEQGDLKLAIFCGHGTFEAVFAPGSLEKAFLISQEAFNLADEFQVPVFILTDQYFLDSFYNVPVFDISDLKVERHLVEAGTAYRRYEETESGVSPRSVPGYGLAWLHGQHDRRVGCAGGFRPSTRMVDKRLRKGGILEWVMPPPFRSVRYRNLVVTGDPGIHS